MVKVRKAAEGPLRQIVSVGRHELIADVAEKLGGEDSGPDPHDFFDTALATCTALTVMMVAQRKQWPLEDVRVDLTHEEDDTLYRFRRRIELVGPLSVEQKTYLLGIANKCPIHRALHKKIEVVTELAG